MSLPLRLLRGRGLPTAARSGAAAGRFVWLAPAALLVLAFMAGPILSLATGHSVDGIDPAAAWAGPGAEHLLGTDALGRDVAVRTGYALRVSLLVALVAAFVSLVMGGLSGLASGFVGGIADRAFLRVLEVLQALPFIFIVILVTMLTRELVASWSVGLSARALTQAGTVAACLGAIQWFSLARYARSLAVSVRSADYVSSMIGMGFSKWRIVWRHLLPNTLVPMLAYATLLVPVLVLEEAFLSFLGFGVQPPYPSLGTLLSDGASAMESAPTMLLSSCGAILLLTVCTNVLASRLASRFAATDVRGGG